MDRSNEIGLQIPLQLFNFQALRDSMLSLNKRQGDGEGQFRGREILSATEIVIASMAVHFYQEIQEPTVGSVQFLFCP